MRLSLFSFAITLFFGGLIVGGRAARYDCLWKKISMDLDSFSEANCDINGFEMDVNEDECEMDDSSFKPDEMMEESKKTTPSDDFQIITVRFPVNRTNEQRGMVDSKSSSVVEDSLMENAMKHGYFYVIILDKRKNDGGIMVDPKLVAGVVGFLVVIFFIVQWLTRNNGSPRTMEDLNVPSTMVPETYQSSNDQTISSAAAEEGPSTSNISEPEEEEETTEKAEERHSILHTRAEVRNYINKIVRVLMDDDSVPQEIKKRLIPPVLDGMCNHITCNWSLNKDLKLVTPEMMLDIMKGLPEASYKEPSEPTTLHLTFHFKVDNKDVMHDVVHKLQPEEELENE